MNISYVHTWNNRDELSLNTTQVYRMLIDQRFLSVDQPEHFFLYSKTKILEDPFSLSAETHLLCVIIKANSIIKR